MDPELAAAAAMLRERGLVTVSPMTAPITEARASLDRISDVLAEGSRPLRQEQTLTLPGGLRTRLYRPDDAKAPPPLIVYAHGGSFAVGSLEGWDHVIRDLVRMSGVAALHVDYRLMPEHRLPAAHEDMLAGFRFAAAQAAELGIHGARLALGGNSASANLALGAAIALRDAAVLLHGLPPTLLTIGTLDPLLDQNEALAARLAAAGVPCRLLRFEGLNHGFIRYGRLVTAVQRCLQESAKALAGAMAKEDVHVV